MCMCTRVNTDPERIVCYLKGLIMALKREVEFEDLEKVMFEGRPPGGWV